MFLTNVSGQKERIGAMRIVCPSPEERDCEHRASAGTPGWGLPRLPVQYRGDGDLRRKESRRNMILRDRSRPLTVPTPRSHTREPADFPMLFRCENVAA